jgi:hypothetical protein
LNIISSSCILAFSTLMRFHTDFFNNPISLIINITRKNIFFKLYREVSEWHMTNHCKCKVWDSAPPKSFRTKMILQLNKTIISSRPACPLVVLLLRPTSHCHISCSSNLKSGWK